MAPPRRYAERTKVPVDKSRLEIERYVTQRGANEFGTMTTPERAQILFKMKGWHVRMTVPLTVEIRGRVVPVDDGEVRRRWRAMLAVVKAKIAAVDAGVVTFEQEFLAHIVKHDGETIGEALHSVGIGAIVSSTSRLLGSGS